MVVKFTYLVSPDFNSDVVPEGYTWDVDAFQELVKATDKATAEETIYTYGGAQGDTNVDYLNAADLTISDLKYDGDGQVVGTTVTANAFNNTGTITTEGAIVFSVKSFTNFGEFNLDKNGSLSATSAITGSGLIRISVAGAVKSTDPIAVTADVSGNVIDLEVTLSGLTETSYQFVSGTIGEGVTFQVNGTVYEEGVVIDGTDYALSTMGGTGLWMVQQTPPTPTYIAKGDRDGNGVSDVMFVWTGNNHAHGYWMNGKNDWWSANATYVSSAWDNLGSYDMNGDGLADAVMFGNVTTEIGGKGAYIGFYSAGNDKDGWQNIGYLSNDEDVAWQTKVGNLTGNYDGKNSIVWYAPERYILGAWSEGTDQWVGISTDFGGDAWKLAGCGDFTGTGKESVLMSYNGGQTFISIDADGVQHYHGGSNWSGWDIRAIGDFAGDGKDDIVLFHEATGSMVMLADGIAENWTAIGQLNPGDWFIAGCGDYNNDQQDDILVRQYSTGMLGYYDAGDVASGWVEMGKGVDMQWTVIA